jgi:hypothetical protein
MQKRHNFFPEKHLLVPRAAGVDLGELYVCFCKLLKVGLLPTILSELQDLSSVIDNKMGSLKPVESKKLKFEDILCMVGENDRWQIIILLFTWIEGALIGCHHYSSSFLAASMPHWCNLDHIGELNNVSWTLEQKKQYAIP